ncbi:MAG: hypothetical protein ABH879_02430 [archaeon]
MDIKRFRAIFHHADSVHESMPSSPLELHQHLWDEYKYLVSAYTYLVGRCREKLELISEMGRDWDRAKIDRLRSYTERLKRFAKEDKTAQTEEDRHVLYMVHIIEHYLGNTGIHEIIEAEQCSLDKLTQMRTLMGRISNLIARQLAFFERNRDYVLVTKNRDELTELVVKEATLLGSPQDTGLGEGYKTLIDNARLRFFSEAQLLRQLVKGLETLGHELEAFNDVSGDQGEKDAIKAAMVFLSRERPAIAFRDFARYLEGSLYNRGEVQAGYKIRVFAIACDEYALKTRDVTCLEFAITQMVSLIKRLTRASANQFSKYHSMYQVKYHKDLDMFYAQESELPKLTELLFRFCDDYASIRPAYESYTRKAAIVIDHLIWISPEIFESAWRGIIEARERYPQYRRALVKLEARMRAVYMQNLGYKGETGPYDKRWRMVGNLLSADQAMSDAIEIVSGLDQLRYRRTLATAFHKGGNESIVAADFEGARWQGDVPGYLAYLRTAGVKTYPLTILVESEKWVILKGKGAGGMYSKLNLPDWGGGCNIPTKAFPYPFNRVGGIRLLSYKGDWKKIDPHEDIHASTDLHGFSEEIMANEITSYSFNVDLSERTWQSVYLTLNTRYMEKHYKDRPDAEKNELSSKIKAACHAMDLIKTADRKKLTRALMRCRNLDSVARLGEKPFSVEIESAKRALDEARRSKQSPDDVEIARSAWREIQYRIEFFRDGRLGRARLEESPGCSSQGRFWRN